MSVGDLTSLANVLPWLNIPAGTSDAVLVRLISQCSRSILDYLQRTSVISQSYTDIVDGTGGHCEFLDQWPVTSVTEVTIDGLIVPPSFYRVQAWNFYPPGGPQAVELVDRRFPRGRQNVAITYQAGYLVSAEAATVPVSGSFQITAAQILGSWCADSGVTYQDGTALTLVSGPPGAGQYTLVAGSPGVYQFSAADAGAALSLSYSYIPATLEDACINWVAERFRYRDHIGQRSKSLGGQETLSYDLSAIPAYLQAQLQPYRKVLPL
jgi:hypothetical protein